MFLKFRAHQLRLCVTIDIFLSSANMDLELRTETFINPQLTTLEMASSLDLNTGYMGSSWQIGGSRLDPLQGP